MRRRDFLALCPGALAIAAPRVRLEDDGMLSVQGERLFILGLYQLPKSPDPWRAARQAGFNLVRVSPSEIETARRHGLYG